MSSTTYTRYELLRTVRERRLMFFGFGLPAIGGTVSLLALVSGTWFPVTSGFLHDLGQFLPSYWLVQAGRVSIDGQPWGVMGWAVVLGWTVVLVAFAGWAYMRDTGRV
jgi:ABC-2 type transport system permease protein